MLLVCGQRCESIIHHKAEIIKITVPVTLVLFVIAYRAF